MSLKVAIDEEALERIIDSYLDSGVPLTRHEIKSALVLMVQGEDIEHLIYMEERGACLNCIYSRSDPGAVKKKGRKVKVDFTLRNCELGKKRRIAGEKCRSQKPLVYIVR